MKEEEEEEEEVEEEEGGRKAGLEPGASPVHEEEEAGLLTALFYARQQDLRVGGREKGREEGRDGGGCENFIADYSATKDGTIQIHISIPSSLPHSLPRFLTFNASHTATIAGLLLGVGSQHACSSSANSFGHLLFNGGLSPPLTTFVKKSCFVYPSKGLVNVAISQTMKDQEKISAFSS